MGKMPRPACVVPGVLLQRACDRSTCCCSNDAIACLMNWENQDNLSDGCKMALPAREEKTQPERSEGRERKSAARKAARGPPPRRCAGCRRARTSSPTRFGSGSAGG